MERRYGKWAANPRGFPENPTKCVYEVYARYPEYTGHQCCRKRGYGVNGEYCKQHAKQVKETEK